MRHETVIQAGQSERHYWLDLWNYRELLQVLAWRDLSVRYKQTVIGVLWALIRPILAILVFTIIFGRIARMPTDGDAPYALMVFAGMLPWSFFSTSLADASNSLISAGNAGLISKVYFPRLIVPIASLIAALVDFVITLMLFVAFMLWYRFMPSWKIIFLPLFMTIVFMASFGIGTWVTALNVKYRDFRYVIPFMLQLGLYISPVGFSSNIIPQQWRLLYSVNPLVGVIDGFRWCLLGQTHIYWPAFVLSVSVTTFFVWIGIRTFRKMERSFADLI